jgi:hypothetical protein
VIVRRDWSAANAKLEAEGCCCRACGRHESELRMRSLRLERAHIVGREHDRTPPVGWDEDRDGRWREPYRVVADRVLPLCGPSTDPSTCHGAQHNRRLELLPLLSAAEQVQAVADAGSIELARKRLAPSAYPDRIAA